MDWTSSEAKTASATFRRTISGEAGTVAAGASFEDAPIDSKWQASAGGTHVFDDGLKLGGFTSVFYERDSSFFDDGFDDSYWVERPGDPLAPETSQGTPQDGDFKTRAV